MPKKTKNKPLEKRVNKCVNVCGRKFNVEFVQKNMGGTFNTLDERTGSGKIEIGCGTIDEYYQLVNVLHEFLELILTLRNARWKEDNERVLFVMDHDKFADIVLDLTRTIIDSGLIKVKEPGGK
jgi:hypothetical protein